MLDPALVTAIAEAVKAEGRSPNVARRLTAWVRRLSEGDVGRDENNGFIANVREALRETGSSDAD
jgi:hypothetical protein